MALKQAVLMLMSATLVLAQRPPFAGSKPIGFPALANKTTTESLGNRFGEGDGTTPKLPLEALGDRDLIDRLSKLPLDKQPFWFINWQALEKHRENPQTYPQKPNVFVDPIGPNTSADVPNRNSFDNSNSAASAGSSAGGSSSSAFAAANSGGSNPNSNTPLENRNGNVASDSVKHGNSYKN